MELQTKTIQEGIRLYSRRAEKFKSSYFSINLLVPLAAGTASKDALLLQILRRGCDRYKSLEAISLQLEELYGAYIEPTCRKKGETIALSFVCSFIDSRYAGENLARRVLELLHALVFEPLCENGAFNTEYFESERRLLIERIQAERSDKRNYAKQRLLEIMFEKEAYSVSEIGDIDALTALTNAEVFARYQELIKAAPIDFYYVGDSDVAADVEAVFGSLCGRGEHQGCCAPFAKGESLKVVEEVQKISQGKLSIGFSCNGVNFSHPDFYPLFLANQIFGGSVASKLFMNVREKLSLCYYASSGYIASKGALVVSSGIDFANFEIAKAEILKQLEDVQQGVITEAEFLAARMGVRNALLSEGDSKAKMAEQMISARLFNEDSPEEFIRKLEAVTIEEVSAAAKHITPDTIYYLKGEDA